MTTPQLIKTLFDKNIDRKIEEVIKVDQTDEQIIRDEIDEYVVTPAIRSHYVHVFETYQDTPNKPHEGIAIWVSGFFGSGKSHFAKLIGHLAANTSTDGGPARDLFLTRLRPGNERLDRIAGLLQQADTHHLKAQLVAFDITALHGDATENVGRIFLRALFRELGLSGVISFAELEIEVFGRVKG